MKEVSPSFSCRETAFRSFCREGEGRVCQLSLAARPPQRILRSNPLLFDRVTEASALPFPLVELKDIFSLAENPDSVPWRHFREGVEIHRLYGDGISGPTAALLRFREDSHIPEHVHEGYEHILVLAGSQRDHKGRIETGTLRVHPPGTTHAVTSEAGCIVLAIYEKPVRFL